MILTHGVDTILDGGDGIDTLDCKGVTGDFWQDPSNGETAAPGESAARFENLIMGAGPDTLVGSSAANLLIGGDGERPTLCRFGPGYALQRRRAGRTLWRERQ